MTPAAAIKSLDRQLALHGSALVLKRGTNPAAPAASVTVKGFEGREVPKELVGAAKQGDSVIITSPTALGAFGEPKAGDWCDFAGRTQSVIFARRRLVADTLVRLELLVRG
ncbi:MAG: hypothetical protein M9955_04400 [Rhizobiaceae bacterium]|jgi:hypothetical protein|nr:hypothetical protein [Rhizobiaceae bacterium]